MRIKSLDLLRQEAAASGENTLKRSLGAFNLVAIGIGVIIGAGLFSLTGIAAANHAGPAVTLSFVVAAVGCAFSALCYRTDFYGLCKNWRIIFVIFLTPANHRANPVNELVANRV